MSKLTLEICKHVVRITERSVLDEKLYMLEFSDMQDYRCASQLDAFLEQHGLKQKTFDTCLASWADLRSTLVPSILFESSELDKFYSLCFGQTDHGKSIQFDRLQESGIINIYDMPSWINAFLFECFPRITIRNEGSFVIEDLLTSVKEGLQLRVCIHRYYFLFTISENGKLLYYSTFDYQSTEDILYHMMFTLQQKDLFNGSGDLFLFPGPDAPEGKCEELTNQWNTIKELSSFRITLKNDLMTKAFELCE